MGVVTEREIYPTFTSEEVPVWRAQLSDNQDIFADHIISRHPTSMPTTCHDCLNYKQRISTLEFFIREAEKSRAA